jgi:hypothetical protein
MSAAAETVFVFDLDNALLDNDRFQDALRQEFFRLRVRGWHSARRSRSLLAIKTHEGSSSNDVMVRNNLANVISVYILDPSVEVDHNHGMATNGTMFASYVNGVTKFSGTPEPMGTPTSSPPGGAASECRL